MAGIATESLGGVHRHDTQHLQTQAHLALKMLMCRLHECRRPQQVLASDRELARLMSISGDAPDLYALHDRLRSWQSLHPAHDDLAVFALDGRLLARLDGGSTLPAGSVTREPWWQAALADGHAEHWGLNTLSEHRPATLLHAHRIDDGHGRLLGVLCLTLDLARITRPIFRNLIGPHDAGLLAVVDAQGQVMVSSDGLLLAEGHPLGAGGAGVADGEVISLPDGDWLSVRSGFWRCTDGPVFGPGWMGLALQPMAGRVPRPASVGVPSRSRRREAPVGAWSASVTVAGALAPACA